MSDRSRPTVSLTMIVKNEAENLAACLGSVADLVDEMVVVDTGSTDATREAAVRLGAKVYHFDWVDSFAAARNESLRRASGDYALWLDGDERFDAVQREKLRLLIDVLPVENVAFMMQQLSTSADSPSVVGQVRLFRRHPEVQWRYRVHEQILPALRQQGVDLRETDIVIAHTGYEDPALRTRKLQRDLRLAEMDAAADPDDPYVLFNCGSVLMALGRPADALPFLQGCLQRSRRGDAGAQILFSMIVLAHRELGQTHLALAACREGQRHYPEDGNLVFQEAILWHQKGDRPQSEARLRHLIDAPETSPFANVDVGLRPKARHSLAIVCYEQARYEEAEAQWRQALVELPGFAPAWKALLMLRPEDAEAHRHREIFVGQQRQGTPGSEPRQ